MPTRKTLQRRRTDLFLAMRKLTGLGTMKANHGEWPAEDQSMHVQRPFLVLV